MSQEDRWCPPTGYDCFLPGLACFNVALPCTSCEHCKPINAEGLEQLYGPFGEICEVEALGERPELVFSMTIAETDGAESPVYSGQVGYNPGAPGELVHYLRSSRPMPLNLEIPNLEIHSCSEPTQDPSKTSSPML